MTQTFLVYLFIHLKLPDSRRSLRGVAPFLVQTPSAALICLVNLVYFGISNVYYFLSKLRNKLTKILIRKLLFNRLMTQHDFFKILKTSALKLKLNI